jgi:hypothetical protein
MIVDLLDWRPPKHKDPVLEKPEKSRVVLRPTVESLWGDIRSLNQKFGGTWTDQEALEVEARILVCFIILVDDCRASLTIPNSSPLSPNYALIRTLT